MTLLKNVSLILAMVCGVQQAYAADSVENVTTDNTINTGIETPMEKVTASTDVEVTMKRMSFTYKEAMDATELNVIKNKLNKLQQLVATVQLVQFGDERQQILQKGLTEVQAQLDLVHESLVANDIATAKQQLKEIMVLKKQYHKERSPSFWQLLFGD